MSLQVFSAGSNDSRLISRGHSTIGIGYKCGHVEGTSIPIGSRGNSSQGSSGSSTGNDSSIDASMSLQVFSASSSNSRLIGRGQSTIGIGHKGGHVEGTSITIGSRGDSSRGDSSQGSSSSSTGNDSSIDTSMSLQVFGAGSSNSRLIGRGHSTIGIGHKGGHMEGTSITIGSRGDSSQGSSGSSTGNDSSIYTTMSLQVFSAGRSDSRL